MKNAKLNIAFAAFGFLLSLIVGIITRASFGVLLLRAIIFAVVFAAISIAVQILLKTVLSVGDEQADSLGGEEKTVGSVVDITLPDEDLPTVPDAPMFNVGLNHQMLNESDYSKPRSPEATFSSQPAAVSDVVMTAGSATPNVASSDGGVGFVATPLASVTQSSAKQPESSGGNSSELPSLSDLHIGNDEDGPVVEDADLPDDGSSPSPSKAPKSKNTNIDNKDTVLMARAISTVLANDGS